MAVPLPVLMPIVIYNIALGISMLDRPVWCHRAMFGYRRRVWLLRKYRLPQADSFATDNFIFAVILIAVILIVGALTFLPATMSWADSRASADARRDSFLGRYMEQKESKMIDGALIVTALKDSFSS